MLIEWKRGRSLYPISARFKQHAEFGGRVIVLTERTPNEIGPLGIRIYEKHNASGCQNPTYFIQRRGQVAHVVSRLEEQDKVEAVLPERKCCGRELKEGHPLLIVALC